MDIPTGPHFMFLTFFHYAISRLIQQDKDVFFIPAFSVQEFSVLPHLFLLLPDPVLPL